MQSSREKAVLPKGPAEDLWRNTLAQIPSLFGRLVYLSSLRDANTGVYQHFGLAQVFGEKAAEEALRTSHQQAFAQWLCFTLEQQKADLDMYLAGLEGDRRAIIETWMRLAPYRSFVPAAAREVERQLYLTDLETILELLRSEFGAASPDPDA